MYNYIWFILIGSISGIVIGNIVITLSLRNQIFATSGILAIVGLMIGYITDQIRQEVLNLTVEQANVVSNLNAISTIMFVLAILTLIFGLFIKEDAPKQEIQPTGKEILIHKR